MTEFAPAPEVIKPPERHETLALPTAEQAEALRPGEKDPLQAQAELAETARQVVETSAAEDNPIEKFQAAQAAAAPPAPTHVDADLKKITLRRELKTIQRKESAPARALSRVIHQPAVRVVSEAAGRTVSRPSGLLGGGILAFVGSSAYLYLAKHIGFEYNYLVFVLLFAAGFGVGIVFEMISWLFLGRRKSA